MQQDITRVLVIRHGETAWNRESRIQGHIDIPLNDKGRWQAARLGAALADEPLAAVYSSDLQRAHDTALAIGAANGVRVTPDLALRERHFGEMEGLTHDEIAARWPEGARRWRARDPEFGPPGGETLQAFYARCLDAATRLAAAHAGQTIALVAHGGVLDCFYRAANGVGLSVPRSWAVTNATINRLLFTPQGFTMLSWADDRHLQEDAGLDETSDGLVAPA